MEEWRERERGGVEVKGQPKSRMKKLFCNGDSRDDVFCGPLSQSRKVFVSLLNAVIYDSKTEEDAL